MHTQGERPPARPSAGDRGPAAASRCPCGGGTSYEDCCRPLHDGIAFAPTAVRLMRSRYSAFALRKPQYLLDTWHPSTRPPTLELDPEVRWTGLEIVGSTGGSLLERRGTVEFRASYRHGEETGVQQENSRFLREASRWLYLAAR